MRASETPGYANLNDNVNLVLGTRFTTTTAGDITAIRLYKVGSAEEYPIPSRYMARA